MHPCKSCSTLVKNNYQQCFDCNAKDRKEDSSSDTENQYKRETLPKCVRNALFINYFKDQRIGLCQCCKRENRTIGNFHAGHIQALINNGSTSLENLVPICMLCNTSMGRYNLNEFIQKYNLHYGL